MTGLARGLARVFTRTVLALLLVASLSLTVLSLSVTGVQAVLSGALSAAGISTVLARETAASQTRRAAHRSLARRTSERVTRRVQRQAARGAAAVFGEAVPVAGVAIIAGSLAYDVKDACDTARDMAALDAAATAPADPEAAHAAAEAEFACTTLIPGAADLPTAEDIVAAVTDAPITLWRDAARRVGLAEADPETPAPPEPR